MTWLMAVPVPWVFILAYLLGAGLEIVGPLGFPLEWRFAGPVGGLLFSLGAIVAGWSLLLFRKGDTTTVPGRTSRRLVTRGPYRFSRNPMYCGLTCAYLGEACLLRQGWPLALLSLVMAYLNWTVIPVEEGRLKEAFPDEYDEYRSRVRRWI